MLPQPSREHLGTALLLRVSRAQPALPRCCGAFPAQRLPLGPGVPSAAQCRSLYSSARRMEPPSPAEPTRLDDTPRRGGRAHEMAARWALRRRGCAVPGLRGLPAAAVLSARPRRRPEGRRVPRETGKTPGSERPPDGWLRAVRGSASPALPRARPPRHRLLWGPVPGTAAAGEACEPGIAGPSSLHKNIPVNLAAFLPLGWSHSLCVEAR